MDLHVLRGSEILIEARVLEHDAEALTHLVLPLGGIEAVDRVRSIKDAASEAGISYRTAWSMIQQMEEALGRPMVVSRAGGPGGGATTLTDECRQLLGLYQNLRRRLDENLGRLWQSPEPAMHAGD